ncbi:MAG: methyltransferase domain-containing protein [Myxococcota bacterium]
MIELVCPRCRHVADGALHVRLLSTGEHGTLACACGAVYPVVDGIPVVLADLDGWLAGEAVEALRRDDLPPACEAILAQGTAVARNRELARVYARSTEGPLQAWLRDRCGPLAGDVLEIGSGLGVTGRDDGVALDVNLGLLRRHRGQRVCGDAADPPFLGERFDAVVLANVLDSCADPALVLAQADALLRPGGRLVVTCAYAFQDAVTPRARRFRPEALHAALAEGAPFFGYVLRHRVVEQETRLAWPLRVSERATHLHEAEAFVTEKSH